MNAYQMDDHPTYYAADTAEAAAECYTDDSGESVEDGYPILVSDAELDAEIPERDEDEALTGRMTTMRSWLNAMTAPGFLAAGL